MTEPQKPDTSKDTGRDAIIFIPGVSAESRGQSVEGISEKICATLDTNAVTPTAKFKYEVRFEKYGRDIKTKVCTIFREDSAPQEPLGAEGRKEPILDVFMMDYSGALTNRFQNRSLLVKSFLNLFAIIKSSLLLLRALVRPGKTWREILQLLYATLFLLVLSSYMVFLVLALIDAASVVRSNATANETSKGADANSQSPPSASNNNSPAAQPAPDTPATSNSNELSNTNAASNSNASSVSNVALNSNAASNSSATPSPSLSNNSPIRPDQQALVPFQWDTITTSLKWLWTRVKLLPKMLINLLWYLIGISKWIIIILTALGLFAPDRLKQLITGAAVDYLCLIYYLDMGERRNVIIGQLRDLLEMIAEKTNPEYRRVHLVSYSFGTIIAIDAMYPFETEPSERFKKIDTLVTIGCPFDIVRSFWSNYFTDRKALPGRPRQWINIYSPIDAISSNFRNDGQCKEPEVPIRLTSRRQERPIDEADYLLMPSDSLPYLQKPYSGSLSLGDIIWMEGLKAHATYWEREYESEISCFSVFIPMMYRGDPVLR